MFILTGAIIGGIIGLLVVVFNFFAKEQRFNKSITQHKRTSRIMQRFFITPPFKRYRNSFKSFDSYGVLYLVGKWCTIKPVKALPRFFFQSRWMYQYKRKLTGAYAEMVFNQHSRWRKILFQLTKWAPLKNSDETLKGLAAAAGKKANG